MGIPSYNGRTCCQENEGTMQRALVVLGQLYGSVVYGRMACRLGDGRFLPQFHAS